VGKVVVDITMSLDEFVAGPNPTLEEPLGANGMELHEWAVQTRDWLRATASRGARRTRTRT